MEAYREDKGRVKRCIYQSKKKVNEQFVNGNRKLFWNEVSNVKGGKVERWKWQVGTGGGRSAKDLEDLYYIDTQEQVAIHICGFDGIRRSNYFGGEPIGRAEV